MTTHNNPVYLMMIITPHYMYTSGWLCLRVKLLGEGEGEGEREGGKEEGKGRERGREGEREGGRKGGRRKKRVGGRVPSSENKGSYVNNKI